MKCCSLINKNTREAYKSGWNYEKGNDIRADNFEWDSGHVETLASLCVREIAGNWSNYPVSEFSLGKDRQFLLQLLDVDAPLDILTAHIHDDHFWKRAFKEKWPNCLVETQAKPWIEIFIEKYYADVLENIAPKNYDPEKISSLVKTCAPFITKLSVTSLVPADLPQEETKQRYATACDWIDTPVSRPDEDQTSMGSIKKDIPFTTRDHIPLHGVIGNLPNLAELHLTFGMRKVEDQFRRDQFQFSANDAKSLAKGLEKCTSLKILRMTRTQLTCDRLKVLMRALMDNQSIAVLDFSHCAIADEGALSIAKFLSKHPLLKELILTDNRIGPSGAEGIGYALGHSMCGLRKLDLRLNHLVGGVGVAFIASALAKGCNLQTLIVSACGIKPHAVIPPPNNLSQGFNQDPPPTCGDLLARAIAMGRTPLRSLDLSVNDLGESGGEALATAIAFSGIVEVSLRRSGVGAAAVAAAERAAAEQRLRRDDERGVRFRRSAGRLVAARRIARGMNIVEADPLLIAQQLGSRPSLASVTSDDLSQIFPLDDAILPQLRNLLPSSRASSLTGPSTSRRSSHQQSLEPVKEVRKSALVRRSSDGSLMPTKSADSQRRIKILVSKNSVESQKKPE